MHKFLNINLLVGEFSLKSIAGTHANYIYNEPKMIIAEMLMQSSGIESNAYKHTHTPIQMNRGKQMRCIIYI